ncbi:MAG: hypothetical protein U5K79_05350 [Cyclobacteriaceae bacterium]|nr:hypothetical protein [Cyclobacteriaceae bacterium]
MNKIALIIAIALAAACNKVEKHAPGTNPDLMNKTIVNSEKLNYYIDTVATGLKNAWGLTFLPNNDLLGDRARWRNQDYPRWQASRPNGQWSS